MSRTHAKRLLTREIHKLNKKIDGKIILGKPYQHDARIHKRLLGKLRKIDRSGEKVISFSSILAA